MGIFMRDKTEGFQVNTVSRDTCDWDTNKMKGKDETKEQLLYLATRSSFGDLETNTFNNVKMGENISEACGGRAVKYGGWNTYLISAFLKSHWKENELKMV